DPVYPDVRNNEMIRDAAIAALIVDEGADARDLGTCAVQLDIGNSLYHSPEQEVSAVNNSGPAVIIYTSGSTNRPKGICYDQRAMMERVTSTTSAKELSPDDRIALLSSPLTIACLRVTFAALLNGASLHFADPRCLGLSGVLDVLAQHRITVMFAVPA